MATERSKNLTTEDDLALLAELGIDTTLPPEVEQSPREERIIAGFEEIERFVSEMGRLPQHGDDRDIFERIYAVRLERLRESEECRTLLKPLDSQGLLKSEALAATNTSVMNDSLTDQEILAALGINLETEERAEDDITRLTHVRSRQEIKAAEEIAQRSACADFANFKPLFKQIKQDLKTGVRKTLKYQDNATINQGDWFVLDGHTAFVAEMGELFMSDYGLPNRRLRVIYDNGTENDLLLRSLQRALNKDKTSRRITAINLGPLFADSVNHSESQTITKTISQTTLNTKPKTTPEPENPNIQTSNLSGCIYVLRSLSDHPLIAKNRKVIHKIGVTKGNVKKRIARAKKDPTYLLADVEIVATFKLTNINRTGLESLLHKFFEPARLDLELQDRFGESVKPREWFFVPLGVIEAAINKIKAGTIHQFYYDPSTASLLPR